MVSLDENFNRPLYEMLENQYGITVKTSKEEISAIMAYAYKENIPVVCRGAGTGLAGPFALAEIEAVRLDSGAPAYRFSGRTAEWVARRHLTAHLTLSHDGGMAMAFCLLEAAPDAS